MTLTKSSSNCQFDCSKFVPSKCKAYCCGPTPIPKETYYHYLHARYRPVLQEVDLDDCILPNTGTQYCTFLSDNYHCLIYEDRPKQCHEFGKVDSPLMQCPFMNKNGKKRNQKEKEKVEREFYEALEKVNSNKPI